ncbi:hypothetical protein [Streptomyces sp. 6N223]|uniref:hypothetical protein n=1 Tax=Streptomyces sp. 6N223 TaxID=3457412 RepID=UPI003FD2815C
MPDAQTDVVRAALVQALANLGWPVSDTAAGRTGVYICRVGSEPYGDNDFYGRDRRPDAYDALVRP